MTKDKYCNHCNKSFRGINPFIGKDLNSYCDSECEELEIAKKEPFRRKVVLKGIAPACNVGDRKESEPFKVEAKTIVDKLFSSGLFKESVTRDDMIGVETFIRRSMTLQLESELIYQKLISDK